MLHGEVGTVDGWGEPDIVLSLGPVEHIQISLHMRAQMQIDTIFMTEQQEVVMRGRHETERVLGLVFVAEPLLAVQREVD